MESRKDVTIKHRCKIDTTVVADKQESADPNGRLEQFKSTVIMPPPLIGSK